MYNYKDTNNFFPLHLVILNKSPPGVKYSPQTPGQITSIDSEKAFDKIQHPATSEQKETSLT